jgi:hypothetical protein
MGVSGQIHATASLPPWKEPRYPLDRKLGGPQSRSGHGGGEKNSQPPPGIEPQNPDRPASSLVAISTEITRLYFLIPAENNLSRIYYDYYYCY